MPEVRFGGKLCLTHNPGYSPGQGQATSYYNPIGPEPGVGYVWMLAADAETLDFEEPQSLSIDATETITIQRLYIDSAVAASGTFPGDQQRAYLLTLRDSRFLLDRLTDVNIAFNCRPGAAPSNSTAAVDPREFYLSSLNPLTGAPYQWSDAIAFLWSLCPASMVGTFPGLPYQPAGVPQNIRYHGVSAWRALHDLLGRVKLTTAYNAATDTFTIIDLAEPQPNLSAVANYAGRLLNDRFPGGSIKARMPTAIRVYFQRHAQHFGTEPDTPRAANWEDLGGLYWQDVPTVASSEPGTVLGLHDDAPAMCGVAGNILNAGELTARASDRAEQWVAAKMLEVARGSLIIRGIAAPLATPGSQVSGVLLRNFGDGWMTELALTPNRVQGSGFRVQEGGEEGEGNFAPPDLARRTWPGYPRVMQLVKVTNSQKDGNGLCQGLVVQANPAGSYYSAQTAVLAYKSLEPCLIAGANGESLTAFSTYLARLNGVAFSSTSGWVPLYIVQPAGKPVLGKTTQAIVNNSFSAEPGDFESANNVQVYSVPKGESQGEETAGTAGIAAFNHFFGYIPEDTWVWCQDDGDGYYISAVIQGDHLIGLVKPTSTFGTSSGSTVSLHAPSTGAGTWTEIDVQLQVSEPADQSVLAVNEEAPTVKAAVRHWPVIDGEQVTLVWTGSIFTIVASDWQGGVRVTNTGQQVSKGSPFPDATLRIANTQAVLVDTDDLILTPYGDFPARKSGRIAWNHYGGEAIAAEC